MFISYEVNTHNEAGYLITEYLVADNKWKEYIYLHGQKFAPAISEFPSSMAVTVVGFAVNGALYYVHNDHLGRAERITNASKSTVWRANNYDFDRVVAYGSADWYNLGFPGQYYDSEKDSYYNYFRDYDPKTGRYIQSDPIGLAGGINTYAYGLGNPVRNIDPLGLNAFAGPMANYSNGNDNCTCKKMDGDSYGNRFARNWKTTSSTIDSLIQRGMNNVIPAMSNTFINHMPGPQGMLNVFLGGGCSKKL